MLQARSLFQQALDRHNRGELHEAEALYRQALGFAPDRPSILTNLSAVLIASGRIAEAAPLCRRVLELEPGNAVALEHLRACTEDGTPADARWRRTERELAAAPDDTHRLNAHALALLDAGRPAHAREALQRAIALEPANAGFLINLGLVAEAEGRADVATLHYLHALRLQPDLESAGQALTRLLLEHGPPDALPLDDLDALLVRALRTPWARPQSLVALAVSRLKERPALRTCMRWADALPYLRSFDAEQRELARDPLLLALLHGALVSDAGLERLLTALRRTLLLGSPFDDDADALAFAAGLAVQCFHNGYAYAVDDVETAQLGELQASIQADLDRGSVPDALALAILGSYLPLSSLRGVAKCLVPELETGVLGALLRRQVAEPAEEARQRSALVALTPVVDATSREVQAQYEEHPYPRWTGLPRRAHRVALAEFVRRHAAGLSDLAMPVAEDGRYQVLNAGCGTGQHPLDLMLRVRDLEMLAVDLSASSLCYARRMAARLGVEGITFAQADILELGRLGRRFHFIDSAGVLHHLEHPERGLSVLRDLMADRGILRIALYSERARRSVVACRAHIAALGCPATAQGIRSLRQQVLALPDAHPARGVVQFSDFYALQECRDLVFHVREHRFSLPQIAELLAQHRLQWLGLQLKPSVQAAFLAYHGRRADLRSPAQWDAFEHAHPNTFAEMYVIWAQALPDSPLRP